MDPLTGREGGGLKTRKLLFKKFNFGKRLRPRPHEDDCKRKR